MSSAIVEKAFGSLDDLSVEDLDYLAQNAETSERYDEMVVFITKLAKKQIAAKEPLKQEQRNKFSVAYKNVVGAKRNAWRVLNGQTEDEQKSNEELKTAYSKKVAAEIEVVCLEALQVLAGLEELERDRLEKSADKDAENASESLHEPHVFYLKMQGDYYRYLREAFSDQDGEKAKYYQGMCKDKYQKAMKKAKSNLKETHATRLGLALNYSVCIYEIESQPNQAIKVAKEAFDSAIEKLDTLNDASYKDSTLIMQLLRDNMTLWQSNNDEAAGADGGDQ